MRAIAVKEFRELRRDRRTLAMLFLLPFLFLVVFGYAASFDIKEVPTLVAGPRRAPRGRGAARARSTSSPRAQDDGRAAAQELLRRGEAVVAVVTPGRGRRRGAVLVDGTELFAAQAALRAWRSCRREPRRRPGGQGPLAGGGPDGAGDVLFNPDLRTAVIMIPGLCGIILVFVGTVATALGVVRERQSGTMEQLAVMPFRPRDVFLGKIAPYLLIAAVDMVIVVVGRHAAVRRAVPRARSPPSPSARSCSSSSRWASACSSRPCRRPRDRRIQLAMMTMLPQFLLSGLFFPLYSMPWAVRWIGYLLPLTWFIKVARGVMVRGAPIGALWLPLVVLAVMAVVVFTVSTLRFRRDLAPPAGRARRTRGTTAAGRAGVERRRPPGRPRERAGRRRHLGRARPERALRPARRRSTT